MKKRDREFFLTVAVFGSYVFVRQLLLYLPIEFPSTRFVDGNWNWSGKLYVIGGSILFLVIYRKLGLKDYFLTARQNHTFSKKLMIKGIKTILILMAISVGGLMLLTDPKSWDLESVMFQLSMPGIDEEIAFRGIMIGLLVKILKPDVRIFSLAIGNPAIIISAILFGLAHGFHLTNSMEPVFNLIPFMTSFAVGTIWGWLTVKSGSVLLALFSHNLGNTLSVLIP